MAEVRDAKDTFVENIQKVIAHLEKGQYGVCASLASEMTHFSWLLGQKDWVFVCEVLESVFYSMDTLHDKYDIPDELAKSAHSKLVQATNDVLHAIVHGGNDEIFHHLRQLRFDTTDLQLKAWTTMPEARG